MTKDKLLTAVQKELTFYPDGVPRLEIPASLKEELKVGVDRVIGRAVGMDLIVTLARSGTLAYEAVVARAGNQGIVMPPALSAHIGRETDGYFCQHLEAKTEQETGEDISPARLEDHLGEYYAWLKTSSTGTRIVNSLAGDLRLRFPNRIPKVLVVDDVTAEGHTLGYSVPFITSLALEKAYGLAPDIDSKPCETTTILQSGSWQRQIVEATWGAGLDARQVDFLTELMLGFREDPGVGLIPLDSGVQLGRLVEDVKGWFHYGCEQDSHKKLIGQIGEENLLMLHEGAQRALRVSIKA
jgi:hypothetical protein